MDEKRRTIFDIAADVRELEDLLERSGGDVSDPEAEAALEDYIGALAQDKTRKVDNYCALIRELEARAAARREEAARLARLATTDESKVERLKALLKWFMETTGDPKIETPRFKVAVQRNGGRPPLEFTIAAAALPEEFRETVTTFKPLEQEIRAALARGEELPFVREKEVGTHLRIR